MDAGAPEGSGVTGASCKRGTSVAEPVQALVRIADGDIVPGLSIVGARQCGRGRGDGGDVMDRGGAGVGVCGFCAPEPDLPQDVRDSAEHVGEGGIARGGEGVEKASWMAGRMSAVMSAVCTIWLVFWPKPRA